MLPPLSATASTPLLYKSQRFDVAAATAGVSPQAEQSTAISGLELNAAIMGKLNLLLLTSDERIAQNFSILADVFGRSLGLARKDGETAASYAQRIVEALANLPPERRTVIETQLDQLFKGLKLQMVIAAFENPSGTAATAMALHIEADASDRDLATKSVVTTYLQNDADERPVSNVQRPNPSQVSAAKSAPIAAETAAASVKREGEPVASSGIAVQKFPGEGGTTQASRMEASSRIESGEGRIPQAQLERPGLPSALTRPADLLPNPSVQGEMQADAGDAAGHHQDRLHNSIGSQEKGSAVYAAQAKSSAPSGQQIKAKASLAIEQTVIGQPDAPQPQKIETLYALKGWQEVTTLTSPGKSETPQPDSLGKFLKASLFAEPMTRAQRTPFETDARQPIDPGKTDENVKASRQALTPDPAEVKTDAEQQNATRLRGDALVAALAESAEAELAALSSTPAARNAAALPMVHYLFARDNEQETRAEELNYPFQHGGGDGFEDQEENPEQNSSGEDEDAIGVESVEADSEEPVSLSPGGSAEGENANDLYWKMAGWS